MSLRANEVSEAISFLRMRLLRLLCSLAMTGTFLFTSYFAFAEQEVRVLVADHQKELHVTIQGEFVIRLLPSLQILKKGIQLTNVSLTASSQGLRLGGEEWPTRALRIEPLSDRDLFINKSRFRGRMDILKETGGLLSAINRLGMENYLYGVLHHEVAAWWPMEALKAQAVAARTYAFYQASVSKTLEYDLKSGTSSQVYGGSTTERYRSKRAVDETRGKVLIYQGKVFPAYFHATCGGITAGAQELWKINLPPLAGGVHCGYCRISPHTFWEFKISLPELEMIMNKNSRPVGQILKAEIISETPSARVGSLRITGTLGDAVIAAKDFRVWLGGNHIRSTLFTINLNDDMLEFHGKGWGHGVGLCQWGAFGQALLGHSYERILQFYYPGSEIVDYDTNPSLRGVT